MILGFPMLLLFLTLPFPVAWVFGFFAVFCLFFGTGPTNAILANVAHPSLRTTGFALNIFIIHALGDAISPHSRLHRWPYQFDGGVCGGVDHHGAGRLLVDLGRPVSGPRYGTGDSAARATAFDRGQRRGMRSCVCRLRLAH